MAHATAVDVASPVTTSRDRPGRRRGRGERKRARTGWLFVLPFAVVFLAFLVAPLLYAFYLSLYTKGLATGIVFAGLDELHQAFTDPSFLKGLWFVLRFGLVLIPVQMIVSLVAALVLDDGHRGSPGSRG